MYDFNQARFTALVAESVPEKAIREAIFELLDFSHKHALKVVGGKDDRTFHYIVSTSGGSAMLFYCDSAGGVSIALGNFPQLRPRAVQRFVRKLGALSPAFKYVQRFEDRRRKGGTQLFLIEETLVDPRTMAAFKRGVLELQREIELSGYTAQ
ncbi:MAG: hypothetical protein V3U31_01030 [Dehalococcoidia bacterium]